MTQAKARTWPCLSYCVPTRSAEGSELRGVGVLFFTARAVKSCKVEVQGAGCRVQLQNDGLWCNVRGVEELVFTARAMRVSLIAPHVARRASPIDIVQEVSTSFECARFHRSSCARRRSDSPSACTKQGLDCLIVPQPSPPTHLW